MNAHGQELSQVEKRADHFNFRHHSSVLECYTRMNLWNVTYWLRINQCTWSGGTTSGKDSRSLYFRDHSPVLEC